MSTLQDAKKIDRITFEILGILKKENLSIDHAQAVVQNISRTIDNLLSFVKMPDYTAFACPNCKSSDIIIFSEPPPNFCGQCGQKDPFGLEDALSGCPHSQNGVSS